MKNPILGIDVWEGQLEIDEAVLKANGVAFIIPRLNSMSGGHHKDAGFDKQWKDAENFYRCPYFVYNPWVPGLENFDWLNANMPHDAKAVAIDIEVIMNGYPANVYAHEVKRFIELVRWKWNYVIYTGEYFLPYLAQWETLSNYWWAQYPDELRPKDHILTLTWDELRTMLEKYIQPANVGKIPGRLLIWQFTGDRMILPGNSKPMDVNVFYGTMDEVKKFFGEPTATTEPTPPTNGATMTKQGTVKVDLNIRSGVYPAPLIPNVGILKVGDKVIGDIDMATGWMHFTQIIRVNGTVENVNGWCSGATAYMTIVDYVPPVVVPPSTINTIDVILNGTVIFHKDF